MLNSGQVEYMVEDTSGSVTSDNKHISSEHGLTCISWNDCPFEPAKLAVGGYSKRAVVLSLERNQLREVCFCYFFVHQ